LKLYLFGRYEKIEQYKEPTENEEALTDEMLHHLGVDIGNKMVSDHESSRRTNGRRLSIEIGMHLGMNIGRR